MSVTINSNNILRVLSDYYVLSTHWSISFTLHNVATITTYNLRRTKPSSKRWNKLTKVTSVSGGGQDLNQGMYGPRIHDLNLCRPWLLPWYLPFLNSFLPDVNICHQFSVHTTYGGQFLWVPFSRHITEVSKNLIRKREKKRWQT